MWVEGRGRHAVNSPEVAGSTERGGGRRRKCFSPCCADVLLLSQGLFPGVRVLGEIKGE